MRICIVEVARILPASRGGNFDYDADYTRIRARTPSRPKLGYEGAGCRVIVEMK